MTVGDLAKFTGKQQTTVRNWVRKASAKNAVLATKYADANPSNPADFTLDEVELILESGSLSRNTVYILMDNARLKQKQNTTLDSKIIASIIAETLKQIVPLFQNKECQNSHNDQLQLEAPKITPRASVRKTVDKYVYRTGARYKDAYTSLYREFGYRMRRDIIKCAKNRGIKELDYIESIGQMEMLDAIAKDFFKEGLYDKD